jgi:hypothetical protein
MIRSILIDLSHLRETIAAGPSADEVFFREARSLTGLPQFTVPVKVAFSNEAFPVKVLSHLSPSGVLPPREPLPIWCTATPYTPPHLVCRCTVGSMRDDELRRILTDANPWWRAAAAGRHHRLYPHRVW